MFIVKGLKNADKQREKEEKERKKLYSLNKSPLREARM